MRHARREELSPAIYRYRLHNPVHILIHIADVESADFGEGVNFN
jgi:hypothetical protein